MIRGGQGRSSGDIIGTASELACWLIILLAALVAMLLWGAP